MGVYINMEMPKSCPCELLGIGYDLCCSFAGEIPARVKEYYECCQNGTMPSWCPLVPVPPHGDLIDKKTVSENLASVLNKRNPPFSYPDWNDAIVAMQTAPTIIPAEEG